MQCAVENFVKTRDNGLCFIDMPTGTGKTYLTRQIIDRFIRGEILNDVETIIYLTPQKKNIDDIYNKLREGFQEDLSVFDEKVLRIYANYECVVERFLDLYHLLPASIKGWDSCRELKKHIETYKELKDRCIQKDILDSTLWEIRKTYEVAFRKDLTEAIYKDCRRLPERKRKLHSKEYSWVKELYPACLTGDRSVLFMTMDKFFSGNDPIISKSYRFISHSITKKALVIIDEIDATKDVILNQEIQNCTDYKIDLIKLFSSISNTLKGREFPVSIFADSLDVDDKNSSLSRFNAMKAHFLDVEKRLNLNYLFKLDNKGEVDRYFLFDDYQLHTITNAKTEKNIILKEDKNKRQNTISISNENDDGLFYRTMYAIKNSINLFIGCTSIMAKNYLAHYNAEAKVSNSDMMEIEQAVSTMLDPYNLDYALGKNLCIMIVDNISIPVINKGKDVFDTDFYMNGFRYYDFKDDISHNESTTMMMCYLDNTPEKYLLSLASKARVIGLSATASIETVTGNYNIEYLKARLGEDYYELPKEDKRRIDEYIDSRLNNSNNINVQVSSIEDYDDNLERIISQLFCREENVEQFAGILSQYQQNSEWANQDKYYDIKRVVRAMKAVKCFIASPRASAMLIMTNKNVKDETGYDVFSCDVLTSIIEKLCEEKGVEMPAIAFLQSVNFIERKENYKRAIQGGKRVIIFSSYQTAGTGQNLQYQIDEEEKDIDSLYLELPTNILVLASRLKEEKDLIKLAYQYEALKTSGEISQDVSIRNIKSAFRKLMSSKGYEKFENYAYNTDSVNNHKLKILIQAVGRICRTKNKNEQINIFVDEEIIKGIDFSVAFKNGRKLNPEFMKIVDLGKHIENHTSITHRNLNKGWDSNLRVETRIENMLNENRISWSATDIEQWEDMREFVLKYPTISRVELERATKERYSIKDFYLEAPEGQTIDHYTFVVDDSKSKRLLYDLGSASNGKGIQISAQMARLNSLVRIPSVKQYFKERGYALSFVKNDFIVLPAVYQNIYKGALGEAAGKAIMEANGIYLKAINDVTKFEKFDYCFAEMEDVYVDFKNWSEFSLESANRHKLKCAEKLKRTGGRAVFVINIVADSFQIHKSFGGRVIEVSTLCKKIAGDLLYELDNGDMQKLKNEIFEVINGN